MKLWTVRHPPTDTDGLCVGQLEVALKISQIKAAQMVFEQAPMKPIIVWSSDLPRCCDLASLLSKKWEADHVIDPRLREISMGDWEGQLYDDLIDDPRWSTWCTNWMTECPPNGETLDDLHRRVLRWYNEQSISANIVLISHAGVVRCLQHIHGMPWNVAMQQKVPHLSWLQV